MLDPRYAHRCSAIGCKAELPNHIWPHAFCRPHMDKLNNDLRARVIAATGRTGDAARYVIEMAQAHIAIKEGLWEPADAPATHSHGAAA